MPSNAINMKQQFKLVIGAIFILLLGLAIGFLVNYAAIQSKYSEKARKLDFLTRDADDKWFRTIIESVDAGNIRSYLKKYTEEPHLAGTPASKKQAEELVKFWEDLGLKTHITKYDVLLSYPDPDQRPDRIELQNGDGNVIFTTQLYEKILRPDQNHSDVVPPFNAYAHPGSPVGELLYVNYGRLEDFTFLIEEKGMNFSGKICIARYGKVFRGAKARFAQRFGAAGLILYSDPADYSRSDTDVYPNTWWLPSTGVQRGNVRGSIKITGDPLTPGYPSIDSAYRIDESDAELPKIPVHPIGYGDAQVLLELLAGDNAPDEWQGKLNFTYRLGPGFTDTNSRIQMHVSTHSQRANIYNAFGVIKGQIEPDRYVLLGNHRDAWVFGAIDPSSGTASMTELSRVFAYMVRQGWKPRRTIIFCSWDAEEHGLIGSKEFVDEYRQMLSSRAVAYINVDTAMGGQDYLGVRSLPLLTSVIRDVAKQIPNPNQREVSKGRHTLYDSWKYQSPEVDKNGKKTGVPKIGTLGSGSDFDPFIITTGITSVDMSYKLSPKLNIFPYPLYHSVYETFHLVDKIMDPGFKFHKAVTQYWGELARRLIDNHVLPMNVNDYAKAIARYIDNILERYEVLMVDNGLTQGIEYLKNMVKHLKNSAKKYQTRLENIDKTNPLIVRAYNDQLLQLERVFIDPLGLPGRKYTRHVVFAPSVNDKYSGSSFPALTDSLFKIEEASGQEKVQRWDDVKKQMSIVTYFIHAAAKILNKYEDF